MLGEAIGDLLPSAVGVAVSPVPIVAVILMLDTRRARTNGPAFALGWAAGLLVVIVAVLLLAGDAASSDDTSTAVSVVTLLLGLVLLAVAVQQWRSRPRGGTEPEMPSWMAAIEDLRPGRAIGLGALLSGLNPKNLALAAAAGATLAQAGLSVGGDVVGVVAFVVIGSATVAGPVLAFLAAGSRVGHALDSIKRAMIDHNAVIMAIVCLVLAAKLIGNGVGGLTD